jgi:hypothetical protein
MTTLPHPGLARPAARLSPRQPARRAIDGPPAADGTENRGVPLEDCLHSYFALHGDLPRLSPHVTCSTSLLDQLPPVDITLRGSPLTDLLQPAYRRFGN